MAVSELDKIMDTIYAENPRWFPYGLSKSMLNQVFMVHDPDTKKAAGFTGWQFRPNDKGGTTGWYAVGLLPEFRGKGLGKKALQDLLGSKPSFVDDVKAFIVQGNEASVGLAKSLGIPYQHKAASELLQPPALGLNLSTMPAEKKAARPSGVVNLQQFLSSTPRRSRFTPDEATAIEDGKSQWFPAMFTSAADSPAVDMHSPLKASLLAGLLGGGAGMAGAHFLGASPNTTTMTGAGSGLLAALLAYNKTTANNEGVEENMRRIPANGTRRDIEADPVYQAERDREAQSGASVEALRAAQMLAALQAVKSARIGAAVKSLAKGTGRTAKFLLPGAGISTAMDVFNENESPFFSLEHPARMKNWLLNTLLLGAARGGSRVVGGGGLPWQAGVGTAPAAEFAALSAATPALYAKDFLRTNMDVGDKVTEAIKKLEPKSVTPNAAPTIKFPETENWLQTATGAVKDNPITSLATLLGAGGLGAYLLNRKDKSKAQGRDQSGRIRVTLPTKKPGDAETTLDLPVEQMALSETMWAGLRRDLNRKLRAENNERKRKMQLSPEERARRAQQLASYRR